MNKANRNIYLGVFRGIFSDYSGPTVMQYFSYLALLTKSYKEMNLFSKRSLIGKASGNIYK